MSDKFIAIPVERLLKRILEEFASQRQVFGIHRDLFFNPADTDVFRVKRYGRVLETPIGVAAGPHTQLAPNIVAAWLCGARYIELKTVQTLDRLEIPRPCIDAEDEGYNCEWSQELRLEESFDQYLDAWILIHILKHKLGGSHRGFVDQQPGFIFNMSVGYDLAGILKKNVQAFLDRMEDCREEIEKKRGLLEKIYPGLKHLDIPPRISDNVTLSTMHGCPPREIEKIARYLVEERGLHTAVKLNPTLLGAERLRHILDERLGFEATVPDDAFAHDPTYPDAVEMIASLREVAREHRLEFGLKLSNTLETLNRRSRLPGTEETIYMSGRALHPLTVCLAAELQREFGGELDISFCGGADCFNVSPLVSCGLTPVTVCTDILKPGGYTRLGQYLEELKGSMERLGCTGIPDFILAQAGRERDPTPVNIDARVKDAALENLEKYAEEALHNKCYHKGFYPEKSIKTGRPLGFFDCIRAPCVDTCPTHQDVPGYMYRVAQGDDTGALEVILKTNPLPVVTGMVCDHPCMTKCTRLNYDSPLLIREIKRFAAENRAGEIPLKKAEANGLTAAVIGAGPSGLSCAYFLALAGFRVRVYEARDEAGGMVSRVIPPFRLTDNHVEADVKRIEKLGVEIHTGCPVDRRRFKALRRRHDFVYLAVGAQQDKRLGIEGEELENVVHALDFLSEVKAGVKEKSAVGMRVAVIGGGNSAVDAARTAFRLVGEEGEAVILYRRTVKEMPADREELEAVQREGIRIVELTQPHRIEKIGRELRLTCFKMRLGEADETGRRRPVKIEGSRFEWECDMVIPAVGQDIGLDFLGGEDLRADPETGETGMKGVFVGGDALRGPASIIVGIADGRRAAENICRAAGVNPPLLPRVDDDKNIDPVRHQQEAGRRRFGEEPKETDPGKRRNFDPLIENLTEVAARKEAQRCLWCGDICNVCVSVCPNRANVSYTVEPVRFRAQEVVARGGEIGVAEGDWFRVEQKYQVLNIVDLCNRCGNCGTFCPTRGNPFEDKPRLCLTPQGFLEEDDAFWMGQEGEVTVIRSRYRGLTEELALRGEKFFYRSKYGEATLDKRDFRLLSVDIQNPPEGRIDFRRAAVMGLLLRFCPPYLYS